jgi:hypothetical protein
MNRPSVGSQNQPGYFGEEESEREQNPGRPGSSYTDVSNMGNIIIYFIVDLHTHTDCIRSCPFLWNKFVSGEIIKVKVKIVPVLNYVIKHYAMKAYGEVDV